MKWFYDLKIGARLVVAFIVTGLIAALVGLMGIGRLADLAATSYAEETMGIDYLKQANVDLIHMDRAVKNALLSSAVQDQAHYKSRMEVDIANIAADLAKAKPLIHMEENKALVAKFERALVEMREIEYRTADEVGSLAESFRAMVAAVNALVRDVGRLSAATIEGKLATRADAAAHQGDFRCVMEGFNATLDAVIGPLNGSAR